MIDEFQNWLDSPYISSKDKAKLKELNTEEIEHSFSKSLFFGTGGIRAKTKLGTSYLNKYTIQHIAFCYAHFLLENNTQQINVCITYDNRKTSLDFAQIFTKILLKFNINVFCYLDIQPTPILSYTIIHKKLSGGISVTASHNPIEDNGVKFYNQCGSQLISSETEKINKLMKQFSLYQSLKILNKKKHKNLGKVVYLDDSIYHHYLEDLNKNFPFTKRNNNISHFIYSPLCGTGNRIIPYIFKKMNYTLIPVKEEIHSDPNFAGIEIPNPEISAVYEKAKAISTKIDCDAILVSDPDCDRIGIMVKYKGDFTYMSANQLAPVLLDYIINIKKIPNLIAFSTIVSSDLFKNMCKYYQIPYIETLTGFKNIGNCISKIENENLRIFAYEESLGYLFVNILKDKDAMQAALLIAEMITYYKSKNKNIISLYHQLNERFGKINNYQIKAKINLDSKQRFIKIIERFKKLTSDELTKKGIKKIIDFSNYECIHSDYNIKFKMSDKNMIKIELKNDSWIIIRFSGTENIIKYYFNIYKFPNKE